MLNDLYLKPLTEENLPLLLEWMEKEDIIKYFGDPLDWISEIRQNLIKPDWVFHFMAITEKPVGFCQFYDTIKAPDGLWSHETNPTAGIDFFIAEEEYRRQGLGSAMLSELLITIRKTNAYQYVVADVDIENKRAIAFVKSMGFKEYKEGLLRYSL